LLYIDGDTVALKDISPLLDMDLKGACVSGSVVARVALNLALARGTGKIADAARAKLDGQAKALDGIDMERYFNSGIMIFDLDKIAELGLDKRMMDLNETKKYANRDQTFLNALFNDHVTMFNPSWNSGWGEPRTGKSSIPAELRTYFEAARNDPGIVHYKGREKPWDAETPPFRLHLLLQARKRRSRARYWQAFQHERRATEAVLGRKLWD
jgi:lipopolysaccharide biosynthesis glycosyltransferase